MAPQTLNRIGAPLRSAQIKTANGIPEKDVMQSRQRAGEKVLAPTSISLHVWGRPKRSITKATTMVATKGNKITGSFGIVARYLARVDEGSFTATIKGSSARFKVESNFGGSATIQLTVRGSKLIWKRLKSTGEMYFPEDLELRKLKPGEKLPYEADDEPGLR